MSHFVPSAATLLQAVADYLEQDLLPTLSGPHRFQTRIGLKVLRTVQREWQLSAGHDAAERQRLAALLGHDGELAALNRALCAAIASGEMPLHHPGLAEHLRQTLREALAIDNPQWIAADPEGH